MAEKSEQPKSIAIKEDKHRDRLHIPTGFVCNNYCIFCMESRKHKKGYKLPTLGEVKGMLLKKKDIGSVIFTFGEPTLNPKLLTWARLAKKINYKEISIVTNGRMLAYKKFCERLINAGVNHFEVSIHGQNSKVHEALTRTPGSFKQTLQGLYNLSELKKQFNFKLSTNTTLTELNYKYIAEIISLLCLLKADSINFNLVEPRGSALKYFGVVVPKYSDVVKKFCETIENLGFTKREKNNQPEIVISGAPMCLINEKYKDYMGGSEIIHIPRLSIDNYSFKIDDMETISPIRERIKLESCKECKYLSSCEGVWGEYINRMGKKEFCPIKR